MSQKNMLFSKFARYRICLQYQKTLILSLACYNHLSILHPCSGKRGTLVLSLTYWVSVINFKGSLLNFQIQNSAERFG